MTAEPCRLRVRYAKDGRLAFLGHLEVMNTIMRCVRRSGLPFEVSNGFAHRMRIQFSQALPVGASSQGEYYDLKLPYAPDSNEALARLVEATPPGLRPDAAVVLPRKAPALEAWANMSRWDVLVVDGVCSANGFLKKVDHLVKDDVLEYLRGDKPRRISLQRALVSCEAFDTGAGMCVRLITRASEQGALRPAILVRAVAGLDPLRVCRVAQWHEDARGIRVDPMDRGRCLVW